MFFIYNNYMKLNILKTSLLITLFAGLTSSCVNDDDYGIPTSDCTETTLVATKTVQELIDQAPTFVDPSVPFLTDDVIEAYVVSSDEGGNFYKSISLQTKGTPTVAPVGFSVPVDAGGLFTNYPVGTKVFVKLLNQYSDIYNGSMRIGGLYELDPRVGLNPPVYAVGRISIFDYSKVLVRSCTKLDESELVRTVSIPELTGSNGDKYLNTLIELENVQFVSEVVGKPYYDIDNDLGGATNYDLTDNVNNKIIFRTSSFANFAGNKAPALSGKVRGILTKYDTDYQFLARTASDINLTEPRFNIDLSAPIIGNAITFTGSFTENFESYVTTSPANRSFPKYINDPVVGTRYWSNTTFGGNKYIQMTSFGGTGEDNRSLFFVPVDLTAANTFSFQSKAGFVNGAVLKVYYILATNYTPGTAINNASLVNITSNFTISPGQASGYPTTFTNSGSYAIPAAVTGNGYFVFEYIGSGVSSPVLTTTMQIDNIVVN